MVNYFIYAKDFSASTNSVKFYNNNGLKTLKQFQSDVNKIKSELNEPDTESKTVYLHWGHECVEVDEKTTTDCYINMNANGDDTLPETIVLWIKHNVTSEDKIKLLYIITDGQIGTHSINICLQLNADVNYEQVIFHAFHKNLAYIDLSVASSFLKGRCTIFCNNEQHEDTDISEEYDYDKITVDNFATEKLYLKSYIRLKYINSNKSSTAALIEIDKLKQLRQKLFDELSVGKDITIYSTDKDTFIREFTNSNWYKNLNNPSYDVKIDIDKSISTLINYIVSDKKSYAFDALKFQTKFNNVVPEEPIADVNFTDAQEIEFPDIILADDKGIPVILCTDLNLLDKIIFKTAESLASFSKFKSTMECPLFLLKDPEMNDSIGYFYTLTVYKELLKKTSKLEPRSRRPYHGGLVLIDTDDFDKYNDYILSATYFNSKKVKYNIGLFYFVLWKICESKQWMDANVVQQFKKYMLRRVCGTQCRIGLSSLPLDPQISTSLPTALWYCVQISTEIFKNDPEHFAHERLRMYFGVMHSMIEILQYLQYDLDLDSIYKRWDLIRHVMTLKKIPTQREKVYYLAERIFKKINGFLVCVIENQRNVKKLNYLKLNHKEMLRDDVINEEINLNDYVFFLHDIDASGVQICKQTYRPYFMIDQNTSFYSDLFKKAQKIVFSDVAGEMVKNYEPIDRIDFSKFLSHYNLYLKFVKESEKYPSLEEYVEYILKKKKYHEHLVTVFPITVYNKIESTFQEYESLRKDVDVKEFISIFNKYVSRVERIKAENKKKFGSDDEINEFITKEECKVNLIKVKDECKKSKKKSINP